MRNNCLNIFAGIDDDIGKNLINILSTKGNYWRHSSGGWNEGIHGWLDNEETELFSLIVDKIKPRKNYLEDEHLPIRLNSLKAMVKEAARLNKGVIWGADLEILYSIDWKNIALGSVVKASTAVKDCLNSIKEIEGEIVKL